MKTTDPVVTHAVTTCSGKRADSRQVVTVGSAPAFRMRCEPRDDEHMTTYFAVPDFGATLNFIIGVRTDETEAAVADAFARLAGWVDAQKIPAAVPPSRLALSGQMPSVGGGGSITQEQFAALNQCEASGENGWRTGRYGLEGHNDVGSWSLEAQQAEVQRIYNESGASAWGVLCRGILGG